MTDPLLTAIKARLQAATAGPWEVFHGEHGRTRRYIDVIKVESDATELCICEMADLADDPQNADFIAHAPEDIAYLLAQLESALARATRAEQERDAWKRDFEAELAGNAALRSEVGARDGETMHAWIARLAAETARADRLQGALTDAIASIVALGLSHTQTPEDREQFAEKEAHAAEAVLKDARRTPMNRRPPGDYGQAVAYWIGPNQPTERTEVTMTNKDGKLVTIVFDPLTLPPDA